MYGWWQTFEHFSFPGSYPIATSEDVHRIELHARENWPATAKSPVIGRFDNGQWVIEYRINKDELHRQSAKQRARYERARRGGSRGNLGDVPPETELFIKTLDLDTDETPINDAPRDDLLAELPVLQRAHFRGQRAPYKYVVLRWAIDRARTGGPRVVAFKDIRAELREVLAPYKLGKNAPDPAYPWFALRTSLWWEVHDVPDDATELTVARHNLRAGLTLRAYELVKNDDSFAREAIDEIARLIDNEEDADNDLFSSSEETKKPGTPALVPVEDNVAEHFNVSTSLSAAERHRREADLQDRYRRYLVSLGHEVMTYRIPTPCGAILATDLYDVTADNLIEVKSTVDRETLRLALGQILDYERFVNPKHRTLLVPEMPPQEMIDLFSTLAIRVVWPTEGAFSMS